ncbi:AzlC family ABC transporter permease [Caldimonas thermodepolymerans]|uniref:Branched-chain amino acid ABC transporter permease n=1 Tax=Caldimonas thermodepolymerans TaxID=215580 RepID=A0A2S5T5L6_9BURK|nr:AzlC family ABC transporter permease [Caldimonas thermodepolymerans]PPE70242.1 branched-chain amino acid ABC transporter permease [Caldimonas thermodepolymerans]QPC32236.1 AzlC family ABC transporter permease [Caldimonas thermodepolymerans]RDH98127.1 putative branched-subunit amino acid permease [Caldimonas thermodepolymerans]UZG45037.1 AzlC family ABC transporter permease [Caldimonas thermodepolymerans]
MSSVTTPARFALGPALRRTLRHPEFRRGALDIGHVALGISAWGLVTGVAMVKSGLSVPMALFMSLLVFAGSAQLTALPLIASGAPIWVVWVAATCVNLRFVIFSAMWRPYFAPYPRWQRAVIGYFTGDVNYVLFMKRFPDPGPHPDALPYFWGGVAINWFGWQASSILGIVLANVIPLEWGLGFAGVLALLGITCSLLQDKVTWLAGGTAAAAAIAAYALPLRMNILLAVAAAVAVGLGIEAVERARRQARRDAQDRERA